MSAGGRDPLVLCPICACKVPESMHDDHVMMCMAGDDKDRPGTSSGRVPGVQGRPVRAYNQRNKPPPPQKLHPQPMSAHHGSYPGSGVYGAGRPGYPVAPGAPNAQYADHRGLRPHVNSSVGPSMQATYSAQGRRAPQHPQQHALHSQQSLGSQARSLPRQPMMHKPPPPNPHAHSMPPPPSLPPSLPPNPARSGHRGFPPESANQYAQVQRSESPLTINTVSFDMQQLMSQTNRLLDRLEAESNPSAHAQLGDAYAALAQHLERSKLRVERLASKSIVQDSGPELDFTDDAELEPFPSAQANGFHSHPSQAESQRPPLSASYASEPAQPQRTSRGGPPPAPPAGAQQGCVKCHQPRVEFLGHDFSNCSHFACFDCIRESVHEGLERSLFEEHAACCPGSGPSCQRSTIPEFLLSQILEADKLKLLEQQNLQLVRRQNGLCVCPKPECNYAFERVQGTYDPAKKETDDDGKVLSAEASEHKAKHRFRCPQCSTIFCDGCDKIPYHDGFTCEQHEHYQEAKKCRFCAEELTAANRAPPAPGGGPATADVCQEQDCLDKRELACPRVLPCGHNCGGVAGESPCLPCLNPECAAHKHAKIDDGDEFCNICYVEGLDQAPTVQLKCGHCFHFNCIRTKVVPKGDKLASARLFFKFLECPMCNAIAEHPILDRYTKKWTDLRKKTEDRAREQLRVEKLEDAPQLKPGGQYAGNPTLFALHKFAFYQCFKCKNPYFGGLRACEEADPDKKEDYKADDLVCGRCSAGPDAKSCKTHGREYVIYKCKYCCEVASWYCWGNTHFCDGCHKRQEQGDYLTRKPLTALPRCPGKGRCPSGVEHPPNGSVDYAIGCSVCIRNV